MNKTKSYTSINTDSIPRKILNIMTEMAVILEAKGWILHSDGVNQTDLALEKKVIEKKIFIPYRGYNNLEGISCCLNKGKNIIERICPTWNEYSNEIKRIYCRDVNKILGEDFNKKVDFVICWIPNYKEVKNKILGIKVAEENNILIVNLANEDILYAMLKLLISE